MKPYMEDEIKVVVWVYKLALIVLRATERLESVQDPYLSMIIDELVELKNIFKEFFERQFPKFSLYHCMSFNFKSINRYKRFQNLKKIKVIEDFEVDMTYKCKTSIYRT